MCKDKQKEKGENELRRTPATNDNRKMVEFMDSHNFSFTVDKNTKEWKSTYTFK